MTAETKKPFKRISQETIQEVLDVSILDISEQLGHSPRRSGKQYAIFCPSPNHGSERTPDTYIEPYKNIFKCFGGGGCGCGGNSSIAYYSWTENGEYDPKKHFLSSVKGVAALMGISLKYTDGSSEKATIAPVKRTKVYKPKETEPRDDGECDRLYRSFLSLCPIRAHHYEEWKSRGYSNEEIKLFGLRSVPNKEELQDILQSLHQQGFDLKHIPGFSQRASKSAEGLVWEWSINATDGYFIPVRNEIGQWYRMRIRRDAGKPKYIWFSSYDNSDDTSCEVYLLRRYGASSGAPLNITVPTNVVQNWHVGDSIQDYFSTDTVISTEGEHKSQLSANILQTLVDGVPGVGNV
ncbi:DNA primase (plasmid) [Alkalihalophilus pseudofirmus OF4]|uniref:DNA primase n=1 Tax=Alkalihalophilus pseudofirmus (strain ATCC BAA-2126 / JCM 17055 / OF4) TaxID=398511 RepID=D3G1E0_ALKPO|nr:CHC2 zinc finger domain-containing protein [Alkalihalophilus pseudofirmus]ADC52166.1 DNA primase [Alkalihalophilus pseudofirmus OF4]